MRSIAWSFAVIATAACGDEDPGFVEGAPGNLTVSVLDAASGDPVARAVAGIEQGGIYLENPDTSRGNPSYVYGARSDDRGIMQVELPGGTVGIHVFADGFRYAPKRVDVDGDGATTIEAEPFLLADRLPSMSDCSIVPAVVAAGGEVVLSATAAAADPDGDPLSEETIVVQPDTSASWVLDPPSPGEQGVGFPDGRYARTVRAPTEPGEYLYVFVTTTEACITSDRVEITLTVE